MVKLYLPTWQKVTNEWLALLLVWAYMHVAFRVLSTIQFGTKVFEGSPPALQSKSCIMFSQAGGSPFVPHQLKRLVSGISGYSRGSYLELVVISQAIMVVQASIQGFYDPPMP